MRIKRFGLRTLLVTTALIAAVVAWISSNMKLSQKEERIIKQLNFSHSQAVIIDSSTVLFCTSGCGCIASRTPPSLINQLGAYFSPRIFERVTEVELYGGRYDDNTLEIIGQLPCLKKLVTRSTAITEPEFRRFANAHPTVLVLGPDGKPFGTQPLTPTPGT